MQGATGQHLILDKIAHQELITSPPVIVKEGSKVNFLVYDNGKLVQPVVRSQPKSPTQP